MALFSVTEIHEGSCHTIYSRQNLDENSQPVGKPVRIECPLFESERGGFVYFMIYDDNMVPDVAICAFLNMVLKNNPITTRRYAAAALHLLKCFLTIYGHCLENLSEAHVLQLVDFLAGAEGFGTGSLSVRSASTVNGYLSKIRLYIKIMHIPSPELLEKRQRDYYVGIDRSGIGFPQMEAYKNKMSENSHNEDEPPQFIFPDEYIAMQRLAEERGDVQSSVMMALQYEAGLREGEVLGLNYASLKIGENSRTGEIEYRIVLCNLVSDEPYQYSKNLLHVRSRKEYLTQKFITEDVPISKNLYVRLKKLAENNYKWMFDHYPNKLEALEADIAMKGYEGDHNYYIFITNWGTRLTRVDWAYRLKKVYFPAAGIKIDLDRRKHNLSHRFRAGFAMNHLYFLPEKMRCTLDELQKMMRHRSIMSSLVYTKPTSEMILSLNEKFQSKCIDPVEYGKDY